jgi:RimJ/RimL family protein N-acetyltransferase
MSSKPEIAAILDIRQMTPEDIPLYEDHFARHRAESGENDHHFMPFEPGGEDGPTGLQAECLARDLSQPGWQRWWIASPGGQDLVVGHVNLKGDPLATGLHRCELGIGIERQHREAGLGLRLMRKAIDFSRTSDSLAWIDLRVFAHNTAARALYARLGFAQCGILDDRFRIGGQTIDDVIMTLGVS